MSSTNVRRRGERWTYYVYVTDAAGQRRQHSKGGFKTKREAEAARVRILHSLETGTYIKPDKLSVAHFLLEEWLPAKRPPVLAESTWESYSRNLALHVVPTIGNLPLQKLDAVRLNLLYRELLDSGRRSGATPGPPARPDDREARPRIAQEGVDLRGDRGGDRRGVSRHAGPAQSPCSGR